GATGGGGATDGGTGGSGGISCTAVLLDDFGFDGGFATAQSVAVAPNGDIYVVGSAATHSVVRKGTNDGGSWTTIDDYAPGFVRPTSIAVNQQGHVFVVGYTGSGAQPMLRVSEDGASFFDSPSFYSNYTDTFLTGVASLPSGEVVVIGHSRDPGVPTLRIWQSVSDGGYWSEVPGASTTMEATGGFATATGEIIAYGFDGMWKTRTGTVGGPWVTSEEIPGKVARSGGATADGSVYVVGEDQQNAWEVHRRRPDGGGWEVVDTYDAGPPDAGERSYPFGFTSYAGGFVYGGGCPYLTCASWTLRASRDGTTWSTVDQWDAGAGQAAAVLSLATDNQNRIIAVGGMTTPSGVYRWIVRRLVCN
ncbi:MAG: hypothetical protein ABL982_23520, partial [Vicinamibacterales bacterium]